MADQDPVIIIGAGIGGLSAAIHLAAKNKPVLLLEKNDSIGGRLGEYQKGGFHWDIGSSWITEKSILEDLFRKAKRRLQDSLQFLPLDPITRYFFTDGKCVDIWSKPERNLEVASDLDTQDKAGFQKFITFTERQHQIVNKFITSGVSPTLGNFLRMGLRDILNIEWLRDYDTTIRDYVRSPYLREILRNYAINIGSNPFKSPGYLSYLTHEELKGAWYLRGGMLMLAQVLHRIAIDMGVKIITKTPVSEILVSDKEVRGVLLQTGKWYEVSDVISNVDVATTYATLLPKKPPYTWELENMQKQTMSPSVFVMLLGIKFQHPEIKHHNVFFSSDTRKEMEQLFGQKIPPEDPTISVDVTCKNVMHHAPHGSENWKITVNVPSNSDYDWETQASKYRDIVISTLKRHGYDLTELIVEEKILTPLDFEKRTGAFCGSQFGISITDALSPFRRPKQQSTIPDGLYFVGSSTHPGGGLEMSVLSGKFAADLIA